jgi:hypothetical protein
MKTKAAIAIAATLFSVQATAETLVATSDTYVKIDNSGPYGAEADINVKQSGGGTGSTVRKGVIEFQVKNAAKIDSAKLLLDIAAFDDTAGATSATFYVWGIASLSTLQNKEETLRYSQIQYLDFMFGMKSMLANDADGVNNNAPFYDGDASIAGKQALGTITITRDQLGRTVVFSSPALVNYIKSLPATPDEKLSTATILLTRQTNSGSLNTSFASKESTTLQGPRLLVESKQSFEPSDDTLIYNDGAGPNGSLHWLSARKDNNASRTTVLEFNFNNNTPRDVREADIALDITNYSDASVPSIKFWVWGYPDQHAQENIDENHLRFGNALSPFLSITGLDGSADGVANSFYQPLGSFELKPSDNGKVVHFTSQQLVDFINADTNGRMTVVITRELKHNLGTQFASKEHTTRKAPTLTVEYAHSNYDMTPDYELKYSDVDDDGDADLLLVVRKPGGGGHIITSPFVIGEMTRTLGYGFGEGLNFWNALSITQQEQLIYEVGYALYPQAIADGVITGVELTESYGRLVGEREYYLTPFTGAAETAIDELECYLGGSNATDTIWGMYNIATVEISDTSSALYVSAEQAILGAVDSTVSLSSDVIALGSNADEDFGAWGTVSNCGSSNGCTVDFGVTLFSYDIENVMYVKHEDYVDTYNDFKEYGTIGWEHSTDWASDVYAVSVNKAEGTYLVARSWTHDQYSTAAVWVGNSYKNAVVWFDGAANEVAAQASAAANSFVSDVNYSVDGFVDVCVDSYDTVVSLYDSSEGWVVGAVEDLDSIEDGFNDFVEGADDTCGCVCDFDCI